MVVALVGGTGSAHQRLDAAATAAAAPRMVATDTIKSRWHHAVVVVVRLVLRGLLRVMVVEKLWMVVVEVVVVMMMMAVAGPLRLRSGRGGDGRHARGSRNGSRAILQVLLLLQLRKWHITVSSSDRLTVGHSSGYTAVGRRE